MKARKIRTQPKFNPLKFKTQTKYMEVLPKGAREYAEKLIANPKLAREFLVRTGIYTKTGKLTRHYR